MLLDWGCHTASDNGIAITIRRVNPNNPLRNVRMIMPGLVGVKFKASQNVRYTWRDMNLYESICDVSCNHDNGWQFHLWGFFATHEVEPFHPWFLTLFKLIWSCELQLWKVFLCFKSLRKIGDIKNIDINWNSILFVCVNVQWKIVLWKLWGKIWSASQQFVWWIGLISIRCPGQRRKITVIPGCQDGKYRLLGISY